MISEFIGFVQFNLRCLFGLICCVFCILVAYVLFVVCLLLLCLYVVLVMGDLRGFPVVAC